MIETAAAVREVRNYVDGDWVEASGEAFESRDPATGDLVATARASTADDLSAAVAAARRAFDETDWPTTAGKARSAILYELARLLREESGALAELVAREMGKPIRYVRERELEPAIDRILFYAGAARLIHGEVTSSAPGHLLNLVMKEPVGVCGLITPWNDPVDLPLRKIGAAIATGCTFVLKPASDAPASSMAIFDLLDRIEALPPGVANGVVGQGEVVGEALAADPRVDKVSFTGSSEVGRRLME
ncbi:MAG TPA: aldehyde dehydrogenase family protein, partial [Solirubrobacterales bacterium]|nr:aldehyde dehydrogenase family protein [Solirubrobacterales bacterium]